MAPSSMTNLPLLTILRTFKTLASAMVLYEEVSTGDRTWQRGKEGVKGTNMLFTWSELNNVCVNGVEV